VVQAIPEEATRGEQRQRVERTGVQRALLRCPGLGEFGARLRQRDLRVENFQLEALPARGLVGERGVQLIEGAGAFEHPFAHPRRSASGIGGRAGRDPLVHRQFEARLHGGEKIVPVGDRDAGRWGGIGRHRQGSAIQLFCARRV